MRPSADLSLASLKVWQDFKEGLTGEEEAHQSCLARKEPIAQRTAPAASSLHPTSATGHKGDGGGFKTSPPQGLAEINEPRLQCSNTPLTMGPPAGREYRE